MKALIQAMVRRATLHWKSSLIGAIEGSGLIVGGVVVTDPKMAKAAFGAAAYLFLKGLFSQDPAK